MKLVIRLLLVCLYASYAWSAVVTRELAADINLAENTIAALGTQAASLRMSSDALSNDLNVGVTNYINDIEVQLVVLQVDETTRNDIHNLFKSHAAAVNLDISRLNSFISDVSSTLFQVNSDLNNDLAALQQGLDRLVFYLGELNSQYDTTLGDFYNAIMSIDQAVTQAVDGMVGTDVVRVFVSLQRMLDVVYKNQINMGNVKIVFDSRANDAKQAISVVLQQTA